MKKKNTALIAVLIIIATLALTFFGAVGAYSRFGAFKAGECASPTEFAKYATGVFDINIPDEVQVIALGEATHGNREFQNLKLDVFKTTVEKYGVRAFALEADFGGCEAVNRYIHGEGDSAEKALSATGFAIYRTDEMKALIEWMRAYNKTAAEGEDLRFYGFDMEQYAYSYRYLAEALENAGIKNGEFDKMWDSEKNAYSESFDSKTRAEIIRSVEDSLSSGDAKAIHFADSLLQNIELGKHINDSAELNEQRDRMMAENVMWILHCEQSRNSGKILISGHNNHIMKCENAGSPVTGSILSSELKSGYFAIGTDFYKSICNLPKPYTGKRITHTFYSYDPLAKASKKCGFEESCLNFSEVPEESELTKYLNTNIQMGSLGESYSILMNFVPRSYRVTRTPKSAYDAMIFVKNATPIEIVKA